MTVAGPGIARGARTYALGRLMDPAANLIDLADRSVPDAMQNHSFRRLLERGSGEH